MLTKILPSEATPLPATSHVLNQSTVGVDSPAGDPGAGGPSGAGVTRPARRGRGIAVLFGLIDETHPNAVSRLDRLDGVGVGAGTVENAVSDLTAWDRWLSLVEALAERSLDGDENARLAFETGVPPEVYLGAIAEPCAMCTTPGAPSHEQSRLCHNRHRVVHHCTCSACF